MMNVFLLFDLYSLQTFFYVTTEWYIQKPEAKLVLLLKQTCLWKKVLQPDDIYVKLRSDKPPNVP